MLLAALCAHLFLKLENARFLEDFRAETFFDVRPACAFEANFDYSA